MPNATRVAYSPGEFAELFGKSQTWGYRQIYAGKVNAITEHGRILIPAKEVERILESAGIYNGQEKPKQASSRAEKLSPENRGIWQRFMDSRRQGQTVVDGYSSRLRQSRWQGGKRSTVVGRIAGAWKTAAKVRPPQRG